MFTIERIAVVIGIFQSLSTIIMAACAIMTYQLTKAVEGRKLNNTCPESMRIRLRIASLYASLTLRRVISFLSLFVMLFSFANLGFLGLGPYRQDPLTLGNAVSIANCMISLYLGLVVARM